MFYDNNDRLTTDQYDNNGNTTVNWPIRKTYDFENHLVQHGAVITAYGADGESCDENSGWSHDAAFGRYRESHRIPTSCDIKPCF